MERDRPLQLSERELEAVYQMFVWLDKYAKSPTVNIKEARLFQVELGARLDDMWRMIFES